MEESKINTIDDYIESCDYDIQPKLFELRKIIHDAVDGLSEKISWKMPTFHMNGKSVFFGAHKNHIGLYPGPETINYFSDRLTNYKTSKGAIQFPNDKPFDTELVQDIVRYIFQNK